MGHCRPWLRAAVLLVAGIACALGAPPQLTTIQDDLYQADGTRFAGTLLIEWKSFSAAGTSTVVTQSVTVQVVNGILRVQLVPTTTAATAAYYQVRYTSKNGVQSFERWAVPPSSAPVRVRDIRISGSGSGPVVNPPGTTQLGISDITGLSTELSARPTKGTGYVNSRAAIINSSGALEGASGTATDCVHVDGTSGPCGTTAAVPGFVDAETPSGPVNGANDTFRTVNVPSPAASLLLYRNGILQKAGVDYNLIANVVTFTPVSLPQPGDIVFASYRTGNGGSSAAATGPQVLCSSTGSATGQTAASRLGTCTLPANLLQAGDRIELRYDVTHEGTASGYTTEARWAGQQLVLRGVASNEPRLTGRLELGIHGTGLVWTGQSWGNTSALVLQAGSASAATGSISLDIYGQLSTAGSDTVTLRQFTVIRYPAQTTP